MMKFVILCLAFLSQIAAFADTSETELERLRGQNERLQRQDQSESDLDRIREAVAPIYGEIDLRRFVRNEYGRYEFVVGPEWACYVTARCVTEVDEVCLCWLKEEQNNH